MSRCTSPLTWLLACLCLVLVSAGAVQAQVTPEKLPAVAEKAFRHPDLDIPALREQVGDLPAAAAAQARASLARLGANEPSLRIDKRSGRFVTVLPDRLALVPGKANGLQWSDLGVKFAAPGGADRETAVSNAFLGYLKSHQTDLKVNPAELSADYRVVSHDNGDLYQIYIPRQIDGIPVRGSFISATVAQGNLVLMSVNTWGDVRVSNGRRLTADEAMQAVVDYLFPLEVKREWAKPELLYVPLANGRGRSDVARGNGYRYELVWSLKVEVADDQGSWELLVDQNGNVLKNEDMNAYLEAKGGVYPKTNDGVVPDGNEHAGWPMPFMFVGTATTDTGGNYSLTGSQTATFNGPYVNMADNCGTDSLTQSGGIDWGTSGGTDCVTPGFGGAGNTHASRSGFYELNRIKEMARSHLPSNTWLQNRLTANMNINNTCNAFWNGSTVNFYRSGGGCSNTGEIAAVFDHEWGHGMDANDVNGGIASPSGEGIADIYSALRLNDSCIGRNFLASNCSGYGDPCLNCSGVRDIDYLKRQSGQPHDYSWSNANCGGAVHCVGSVYAEAVWSLAKRKLPTLYGMDSNTAHEVTTRLSYIGAGVTSIWFSGGPPNGGCGGSSGYMNYLAADDDNGNLNDGTPHMTAIFQAFNDQEIACGTPTVQDSGCAGTPTTAPNVTATPGNNSVTLSWGAVAGASGYDVFRAEGIFQCDFGKVKIGSTAGTSFTDTGLQNGRDYSYVVIPKGPAASCFGPASACDTVQPASGPQCTVNADCDDGLFCNGAETCNAGTCVAGSNPCGPTETCNETTDVCEPQCTVNADCDDGLFCNGSETCVANVCQPGSDPCPGQSCDEGANICTDQNGPQNAAYDATLGAPKCALAGSSCDSTTLLDSRDTLSPPEPNQPNTLDTCTDGTSGIYHSDESIDRIVVSTLDGADMTEGATVRIDVTVFAWSTGSSDTLDLYYTTNVNNPVWTYITSIVPPGGGLQTLSAQYTLPAGSMQAVRGRFRYQGTQASCGTGSWDDHDDLAFGVKPAAPECTVNADCDDGLFCNGAETCVGGSCQAGSNPCAAGEACDETNDICVPGGGCVVDDDFEAGAPDWINDPASTCTTGAYVTGNPTNPSGGRQIVGSHSGVTSIFTATNISAGVDDVDNGNCILGSPPTPWSVPTASTLSVWYWHGQRDAGDDPSGDFFRLEYSINGGATWTTLASRGDQTTTPVWTNVTAPIPAGSQVKLRMQCSDGPGPGDLVECGIDDFSICN